MPAGGIAIDKVHHRHIGALAERIAAGLLIFIADFIAAVIIFLIFGNAGVIRHRALRQRTARQGVKIAHILAGIALTKTGSSAAGKIRNRLAVVFGTVAGALPVLRIFLPHGRAARVALPHISAGRIAPALNDVTGTFPDIILVFHGGRIAGRSLAVRQTFGRIGNIGLILRIGAGVAGRGKLVVGAVTGFGIVSAANAVVFSFRSAGYRRRSPLRALRCRRLGAAVAGGIVGIGGNRKRTGIQSAVARRCHRSRTDAQSRIAAFFRRRRHIAAGHALGSRGVPGIRRRSGRRGTQQV